MQWLIDYNMTTDSLEEKRPSEALSASVGWLMHSSCSLSVCLLIYWTFLWHAFIQPCTHLIICSVSPCSSCCLILPSSVSRCLTVSSVLQAAMTAQAAAPHQLQSINVFISSVTADLSTQSMFLLLITEVWVPAIVLHVNTKFWVKPFTGPLTVGPAVIMWLQIKQYFNLVVWASCFCPLSGGRSVWHASPPRPLFYTSKWKLDEVHDCSLSFVSCIFLLLAAVAGCILQVVLDFPLEQVFLLVFEAEMSWFDRQRHGQQNAADVEAEVPGPAEHRWGRM